MFTHNADHAFPCLDQVTSRVLRSRRTPTEADYKNWRIVIHNLEVAEWCEIPASIPGDRAYEADGTWYAGDQKFVVLDHGAIWSIRVDFDVFVVTSGCVVDSLAINPC